MKKTQAIAAISTVSAIIALVAFQGCTQKLQKSAAKSTEPAAQGDSVPLQADVSECAALAVDPEGKRDFVFNARLRTGKAKGQCIKNDVHRPITSLDEAEIAKHIPAWASVDLSKYTVIANVSHVDPATFDWANEEQASRRAFWFAKIPLGKVKDTYFQLEHFPSFGQDLVAKITAMMPEAFGLRARGKQIFKVANEYIAGHTQMRLEFSEDVELVSQFTGKPAATRNLIFTVEAVGQQNYAFDLVTGTQKNFVAMHRVTTMEMKFYDMMIASEAGGRKYHMVEQVKLRIGNKNDASVEAAKQAIVPLFLHASEMNGAQIKHGTDEEFGAATYHTISNNCTNAITRLIDSAALSTGAYTRLGRFTAGLMGGVDFFPALVHNGLEDRGVAVHDKTSNGSRVYPHATMCEEEGMKPMREKLFEFMKTDAAAGKLSEGLVAGTCPQLTTTRPKMLDLFWVNR